MLNMTTVQQFYILNLNNSLVYLKNSGYKNMLELEQIQKHIDQLHVALQSGYHSEQYPHKKYEQIRRRIRGKTKSFYLLCC